MIAGEDTNFVTHNGFDYKAIQKAWDEALRDAAREAKKEGENDDWLPNIPEFKRGASTISQQLAKNLYLSSRRSFFRKGTGSHSHIDPRANAHRSGEFSKST